MNAIGKLTLICSAAFIAGLIPGGPALAQDCEGVQLTGDELHIECAGLGLAPISEFTREHLGVTFVPPAGMGDVTSPGFGFFTSDPAIGHPDPRGPQSTVTLRGRAILHSLLIDDDKLYEIYLASVFADILLPDVEAADAENIDAGPTSDIDSVVDELQCIVVLC